MVIYSESYRVNKGDFSTAGEASAKIKGALKRMGLNPAIIREVAISSYELELNLVIHSEGGELILEVGDGVLSLISSDCGPGIADTSLVMQEGYSTAPESVRAMGFGAGMGLPNVKRHSHSFSLESELGKGTRIVASYNI
ncbi:MAG: anti-sigma regulatory factor [Clostridia bacterium]|nr:anti-sigma regulatory factor [Clostridia bacterium]